MMNLKPYEQVALRRDVPEDGLKSGDVATLLEIVPGPTGGQQRAVIEVFNALGKTICVTDVSSEDIEPLKEDEVLAIRRLAQAG
jgi:uncharacterized protein DUF4926